MRKLLVIANLVHASPRIPGIVTYLQEFGWKVTIITPYEGDNAEERLAFPKQFLERINIVNANYRGDIFWIWRKIFKVFGFKIDESITEQIKEKMDISNRKSIIDRFMKLYQTIFAYPDTEKTWTKSALRVADELLEREQFSAILSSSPFPTSHIVAAKLKRKFSLPWVADFRDPWTKNHNYPYNSLRRFFDEKLELKTFKNVTSIIAATPLFAKKQGNLLRKKVKVITNGFDHNNINIPPAQLTKKFTITYTGNVYAGNQDPSKLFTVIKKMISNKKIHPEDIQIRFYGQRLKWVNDMIFDYGLSVIAKQYGLITRIESLRKQQESQILLLLNWEDPSFNGVYPTKCFEYFCAQRPILASGGFPEDDIKKILDETKAGIYAPTLKEIEEALLGFYYEYKQKGTVSYKGNSEAINKYNYSELAEKLSFVLDEAIE